jgi:hypothetical protein
MKKAKKDRGQATLVAVKKEMAKPRMAKSARTNEVNLAAARTVRGRPGKTKP